MNNSMNRREMLGLLASVSALAATLPSMFAAEPARKKRLGVCAYSYSGGASFRDALDFLEHCHQRDAGGIQITIGSWDSDYARNLRTKADSYQMFLEGQIGLPRDDADVERFESRVRIAKEAGITVLRTAMLGGRRYETFDTAEAFRQFAEKSWRSLVLAEPSIKKHRVRLAIENHKDWRVPELLDILKRISSEYVGVCVDIGNSIALLENPMEVVEAYAPWAFSTHMKDMGVQEYEEGFLLSEVPLGEGFLDLPKMIEILLRAKPEIQFTLEMITRDPLKIPCLTKKYWATFETLPGRHLADTLAMVRAKGSKKPLPRVTGLAQEEKVKLEDENVRKCLAYAREHLGL